MTFATNMRNVALTLLTKYGRNLTFVRTSEVDYDPTTSLAADGVQLVYTGVGHPSPYTSDEIATGLVLVKDIKLLLYSVTLPLVGDTAAIGGDTYRVMNVNSLNAQGSDIAYQLQLRL